MTSLSWQAMVSLFAVFFVVCSVALTAATMVIMIGSNSQHVTAESKDTTPKKQRRVRNNPDRGGTTGRRRPQARRTPPQLGAAPGISGRRDVDSMWNDLGKAIQLASNHRRLSQRVKIVMSVSVPISQAQSIAVCVRWELPLAHVASCWL